jgi:hypothetical protein
MNGVQRLIPFRRVLSRTRNFTVESGALYFDKLIILDPERRELGHNRSGVLFRPGRSVTTQRFQDSGNFDADERDIGHVLSLELLGPDQKRRTGEAGLGVIKVTILSARNPQTERRD